jgi:signal transduction histidine kinase
VALSVLAASWVFHQMDGSMTDWPAVLGIAAVSLVVDLSINASLFIVGAHFLTGLTPAQLVHNTYGGSRPVAFASGYASFGLLAVVLATLFASVGTWALLAFAIPLLLGRQMFVHWKKLTETESRLDAERRALNQVSSRIADERKDERLTVAAGIHDEVLPPLYKVHLMGHVLRQDLASGRLLDLDSDVPDLLEATDAASRALRDLIGNLRRSTLGPGGLAETLRLLARDLSVESGIRIEVNASPIPGTPLVHLLLYQMTREALVNAVKHSRATSVHVTLDHSDDEIRVVVVDDGAGFQPSIVDRSSHFGLELMRERVELAGGKLFIESAAKAGTRIIVKVPAGSSRHANRRDPDA